MVTGILDLFYPYQRRFFLSQKKRRIWLSSRQVGKSFAVAGLLAYKALSRKNGLSLCVSTGARAASEIIRKCVLFAEAVKKMTGGRIDYVPGHDHVNFTNGSRILSLPNNPAACRGFTAECVCLDEAAFIENLDEVIQAIAPTLTRNPDAEFVMTSTPAGKNGKFYELYQAALVDPEWEVQTTTIHDAVNEGFKADLDSLRQLCPDPDVFSQEYECVFQDEYGAWLNPEDLLFDDIEDFNGPWWLGLDVGVRRDASGLAAAYEKNGRLDFARLDYLRNMKFEEQFQAVKAFCSQKNVTAGYVDEVGVGYGLAERINREISARIKGFSWNASNKTEAFELFKTDALSRKIGFPRKYEEIIKAELKMVSKIVTPDGKTKYTAARNALGHGDLVSGMILAHQAWRKMPLNAQTPASVPFGSAFGGWGGSVF